mmetsp:Transcript_114427/g.255344  ORF Transcript_114427/g.255344 Transcript_114427/m.255344 type:complete len:337 (+) Transcript_114427:52-1062(+)
MSIHHACALQLCIIIVVFCICAMATASPYDEGCEPAEVSMLQKSYHLLGDSTPLQDDEFNRHTYTHTRKPVIWIHVHKNAGTTICELARANNESIVPEYADGEPRTLHNCMWYLHDSHYLINTSSHTSCADRRHAFATGQWTFGMIEREIHEDDICEGFMYGILLREPVSHALSFANYELIDVARDLECLRSGALSCDQWMFIRRPESWGNVSYPTVQSWIVFDNYQVRTLLGEDGLKIPPGQVTEQHARKVIAMLSKFDLVSLVEELDGAMPRMLGDTLGWRNTSVPHANTKMPYESIPRKPISDQDMAYIEELNKMDRMVYDYFKHVPIDERGR